MFSDFLNLCDKKLTIGLLCYRWYSGLNLNRISHAPQPCHPDTKRTDPEFPAGAPWTPLNSGPCHPEPKSIFTTPFSVGPKVKKIMIPYEVPCQKFYKIFHSSLTELYPLLPGRQTFSINHCSLAHT